jgi:two-component system sensor histidine kinase RegB
MAPDISLTWQPPRVNLQRLFELRNLALVGQCATIAVASLWLGIVLPLSALGLVMALLALFNGITWLRLRIGGPVGHGEFFAQLCADVVALTALLYLSGGPTNPFVSLYLLPLTIAAAALPGAYAWAMAMLTVACYSFLLAFFFALAPQQQDPELSFSLHVFGMWLTFVVSAGLIAGFVGRMSATLRQRNEMLARSREAALRNERLVALGALAAGAAHELGTPLATMAVIIREMQNECGRNPVLAEDLATLRSQVGLCKDIITRIVADAGANRAEGGALEPLDRLLEQGIARWQAMRPGVTVHFKGDGLSPAPEVLNDHTLSQALLSLYDNAADASPQEVEVQAYWDSDTLRLAVLDRGPGVSPEVASRAGQAFFTTKPEGDGLGLFLARTVLERFGGSVRLNNREGGGACTELVLPLAQLSPRS